MAQKDLVVRLLAQDGISATLKDVKKEIQDLGQKTSVLDGIRQEFDRITSSTAPAKRQLKDLQALMGSMNLAGLQNTSVFTEMAEYAGNLRDAMDDARRAVSAFADDQFRLEAYGQAMSLVVSAGSSLTTVMELFGAENEAVTQSIKKFQMALTLMNTVQQAANILNKESALMLRLKQIRMIASAAATSADTAATAANTVAGGANSVAVAANNAARKAWNVTVAIGKALMGDWTGLVLVGAAALATYAIATHDSTDETKKQIEETKKQGEAMTATKSAFEKYRDEVGKSTGNMVGKFKALCDQWRTLQTIAEKKKFIDDNKAAFQQLGLAINDVVTAQKTFVDNADKVVEAMQKMAVANAARKIAEENYEDVLRENKGRRSRAIKPGRENAATNISEWSQGDKDIEKYIADRLIRVLTPSQLNTFRKTGTLPGNADVNRYLAELSGDAVRHKNQSDLAAADRYSQSLFNMAYKNQKEADAILGGLGIRDTGRTGSPSSSGGRHAGKSELEAGKTPLEIDRDKLKQIRTEIQTALNDFNDGLIDRETLEATRLRVNQYFSDNNIKAAIELEYEFDEYGFEKARQLKREIEAEATPDPVTSTIGNVVLGEGQQRGGIEDKRFSIPAAVSQFQQLQEDVRMKIIGLDEAVSQIEAINELLKEIGAEPIVFHTEVDGSLTSEAEHAERLQNNVNSAGTAFQNLGSAMSALSDDGAMAKAAAIASAIGQLALSYAQSLKSSITVWDWIAGATAGAATLASLVGSLSKFETGGIVGGSSYSGDHMLVRANSGEMILNTAQQANLFRMLDGGGAASSGLPRTITLKVKGPDLIAVLGNANDKRRRQS